MKIDIEILSRQKISQNDLSDLVSYAISCEATGDNLYLIVMKAYLLGKIHGKQEVRSKRAWKN